MPTYQYKEPATGEIVERFLPVEDRDRYPGRLTVPRRVNVCPRGKPSQGAEVLRGFAREESKPGGSAALHRTVAAAGLTPSRIKEVWADDYKTRPGPYDGDT
jgi:hypothetical protein